MIAKQHNDGRYTVISPNGFICLQESAAVCIEKLVARGLSEDDARETLNRRVKDSEWRSTFIQATAATAVSIEASLEHVAETADVDDLREHQAELSAAIDSLQQEFADDRRQQERRELESQLEAEAERMRQVLVVNHVRPSAYADNLIWQELWKTPAGRRLQELRVV